MASAMREDAATPRISFAVVFIIPLLDVNKTIGHVLQSGLAISNLRSVFCIICNAGVVFFSVDIDGMDTTDVLLSMSV